MRALERWQDGARLKARPHTSPLPSPQLGKDTITPQTVRQIVQAHAAAPRFWEKRSYRARPQARRAHHRRGSRQTPVKLKRLGRYKSFDVLGECLEFGASFNIAGIHSGRCCKGLGAPAARTELRLRGAKMVGLQQLPHQAQPSSRASKRVADVTRSTLDGARFAVSEPSGLTCVRTRMRSDL